MEATTTNDRAKHPLAAILLWALRYKPLLEYASEDTLAQFIRFGTDPRARKLCEGLQYIDPRDTSCTTDLTRVGLMIQLFNSTPQVYAWFTPSAKQELVTFADIMKRLAKETDDSFRRDAARQRKEGAQLETVVMLSWLKSNQEAWEKLDERFQLQLMRQAMDLKIKYDLIPYFDNVISPALDRVRLAAMCVVAHRNPDMRKIMTPYEQTRVDFGFYVDLLYKKFPFHARFFDSKGARWLVNLIMETPLGEILLRRIKDSAGAAVWLVTVSVKFHAILHKSITGSNMDQMELTPETIRLLVLTPANNPHRIADKLFHQVIGWLNPGFPIPSPYLNDPFHAVQPTPSMAGTAGTNEADEEDPYALLEWLADPEASLQRRIKAKLPDISKKQRKEVVDYYVQVQRMEIARDQERHQKAGLEPEYEGIDADDTDDDDTPSSPTIPTTHVATEADLWATFTSRLVSLPRADKFKFVSALSQYAYKLAVDCRHFTQQAEKAASQRAGRPYDETARVPSYRDFLIPGTATIPNPSFAALEPHVQLACYVLPMPETCVDAFKLAKTVITIARKMERAPVAEAGRVDREDAQRTMPDREVEVAGILAELAAGEMMREAVTEPLGLADRLVTEQLVRAARAGVFGADVWSGKWDEEMEKAEAEEKKEQEEEKEQEQETEKEGSAEEEQEEKEKAKKAKKKKKKAKKAKGKQPAGELNPAAAASVPTV